MANNFTIILVFFYPIWHLYLFKHKTIEGWRDGGDGGMEGIEGWRGERKGERREEGEVKVH
jgi:hypothetical protein